MHITVTIPTFNRAHLVGKTIESVLLQTFQDYDVLIIDDASEDKTIEVIKPYCQKDPRVQLEINTKNLGLTGNWNRCLDLAQGPLVQVLLSDDMLDPDYLTLVSDVFDKYPMVGLVASSCRYIDANGKAISAGITSPDKYFGPGDDAVLALLSLGYPHVSSVVFKRECYELLGKYDSRIWHGPDMEFDARIISKYGYFRFGSPHTSFRRHGSNMGNLEFLRDDFLNIDIFKRRITLGYLSQSAREELGIYDLDAYLLKTESFVAMNGVMTSIAYGHPKLSRYYLRKAYQYDKLVWRSKSFWKGVILNIWPQLGRKIMQKRLGIQKNDDLIALFVENSLRKLPSS